MKELSKANGINLEHCVIVNSKKLIHAAYSFEKTTTTPITLNIVPI